MDRIPAEITNAIASFIQDDTIARLSTLSRKWQAAIERRTFARLAIRSSDDEMRDFARILTPFRRASYLRDLEFTVSVPFDESTIKPRSKQQERFSEAFTAALLRLFEILAPEEAGGNGIQGGAHGSSGCGLTLTVGYVTSTRDWKDGREPRYLRPRIGFLHGGVSLPIVKCISRLVFVVDTGARRTALRTGVDIASRLPNANRIEFWAGNAELVTDAQLHKEDRQGLAAALANVQFFPDRQCSEVVFRLEEQDPYILGMKPGWVYPDCTNESSYEPLGTALRQWSHNLSSLEVCGVFDECLFGPTEAERRVVPMPIPASPWSRLTNFVVQLGLSTPTGGWYFTPNEDGADYPNRGLPPPRNVPCEETIQPLFASWANAIAEMPALQQAALYFRVEIAFQQLAEGLGLDTSVENWLVEYQAPGTTPNYMRHTWAESLTSKERNSRRLVFARTGSWRPWKTTMKTLHEVGKHVFSSTEMIELEVNVWDKLIRDPASEDTV